MITPRLLLLAACPVTATLASAQTGRSLPPGGPASQLLPDRAVGSVKSQVTTKDPYTPELVRAKAQGFIRAGMPVKAVDFLMDLKVQYLDFYPHQLLLADCFAAAGMAGDARTAYNVVLTEKGYSELERRTARARLGGGGTAGPQQPPATTRPSEVAKTPATKTPAIVPPVTTPPPALSADAAAKQAAEFTKAGKFKEARALLDHAASTGTSSRWLAEARINLAIAESQSGAWGPAAADFRAAELDEHLTDRERALSAKMSREMLARVKAGADVTVSATHMREGTLWSSGVELSTGAFGSDGMNIVFLRGMWDEIGLGHQRLLTQRDVDRQQAELAWRRLNKRGYYGELSAGGGSEGPVFGAAVGRYELPGTGWELRLRANDPAKDTLLLNALGGTQDSVSFNLHRRFSEHWFLDATVGWRRVEVENHDLGEGIDLEFMLARTLLEEKGWRPALSVSYVAEVHHFYRRCLPDPFSMPPGRHESAAHDLLADRINRHGLLLTAKKQFGARWSAFLYGGAAYEFEDDRAEALAGAGLTAYLSENATLVFSLDYASSGNAANAGHHVLTGNMRVRVTF